MTTSRTVLALAVLLTTKHTELDFIKRINDALKSEFRPPLGSSVICQVLQVEIPEALQTLVLPANEKRETRLESFLANFTTHRIEWICEVRSAEWNKVTGAAKQLSSI